MSPRTTLVDAFGKEDELLRRRLSQCPEPWRERPGPGGRPSLKELLGHIAFWDDFTVEFFTRKLASDAIAPKPPLDFEEQSAQAQARFGSMPYGEVLGRYLEATGSIIEFLESRWDDLSWREQHHLWTPLRHRRGHRLTIESALERWAPDSGLRAECAEG